MENFVRKTLVYFVNIFLIDFLLTFAGLPDDYKPKSQFGYPYSMKGLGMENVDIYVLLVHWNIYGHLVYIVVIMYILPILVHCTKKNLATLDFWRTRISAIRLNLKRSPIFQLIYETGDRLPGPEKLS
jgi:hypothetical protein